MVHVAAYLSKLLLSQLGCEAKWSQSFTVPQTNVCSEGGHQSIQQRQLWQTCGEGGREGGGGGKGGRERYIVIINFIFSLTSCRGPWLTSPDSQVDEVVSIAIPLSVHFERIDLEIATLI